LKKDRSSAVEMDANGQLISEEEVSSRAIVRLAADPPVATGFVQRRTSGWLLRPYPLGLRFSGKNMSPLPCWLVGAQSIALNMSVNDLAVQLHFALFKGAGGYVLKPPEMVASRSSAGNSGAQRPSTSEEEQEDDDVYWPPPRSMLEGTTIHIFSLHNEPKHGERRPHFNGSRGACHAYHPELSGTCAPPDKTTPSSPHLRISLCPIGGVCAISRELPLPPTLQTALSLPSTGTGLNATFDAKVHCLAAEPHATFLRIAVATEGDGGQEVCYETLVLGRLRKGHRIFLMRGMLGTRIELCYLFVHIGFSSEPNLWPSSRQVRVHNSMVRQRMDELDNHANENALLKQEIAELRRLSVNLDNPVVSPTDKQSCCTLLRHNSATRERPAEPGTPQGRSRKNIFAGVQTL